MTVHRAENSGNTVSFVQALASSARFKVLFDEGMQLVEEAAAYLDGDGRPEAKALPTALQQPCAAESMRLTTRLMQIASWLLIRRAVGNGELTPSQASADRVKVRASAQAMASSPRIFAELPARLQHLTMRSLRLQTRILHLDRMVNVPPDAEGGRPRSGLEMQFDRLRSVYRSVA